MVDLQHKPDVLPEILQQFSRLTSPAVAVKIARAWGGRVTFYFPERLSRSNKLAKLIGHKEASILCAHFARERIKIPSARTYLRWYDARYYYLVEKRSKPWIAEKLGVNLTHVRQLLQGLEAHDADTDLPAIDNPRCPMCGRSAASGRHHVLRSTSQLDFGFPAS
jgi:hypothetical protein